MLDKWSEDPWTNGVQVDRMEDMEKLIIQTRNSQYEIIIIDGRRGEILVRGGQFFPELTPARLAGATLGGSFCKMRGIYAGFRMEINANGKRTVTTPVESIGVSPEVERNSSLSFAPRPSAHKYFSRLPP